MTQLSLRLFVAASAALLISCTSFWQIGAPGTRGGVSSSLVDYLYPKGEIPPDFE